MIIGIKKYISSLFCGGLVRRIKYSFFMLSLILSTVLYAGTDFYVATSGSDTNDGSEATPWKTIQYSADHATPGSTVHISAGIYYERVQVNISGNTSAGYITFMGDPAGGTIIDGSNFTLSQMKSFNRSELDAYGLGNASALVEIIDQSYVRVQNIEIRKYICSSTEVFPMGVMVIKRDTSNDVMTDIDLVNLDVHNIENNNHSDQSGAQGMAAYGGNPDSAIQNLNILGCEVHDCRLGQSESMTLNGNVDGFRIAYNSVHNNDNIGIDCIGWEGTAGPSVDSSDPAQKGGHHPNDRARNGLVEYNLVYSCSTDKPVNNPTYPANDFSAGGIYIDGGKDITIENNKIYQCDVGVEIASEHDGVDDNGDPRNTSGIVCRNNVIYYCGQFGIGIGGYDKNRGDATDCKILQNTVYKCSSLGYGGGQIYINKAHHNLISGNILVARDVEDVDDYDGYNNSGDDWAWDHGLVLGSSLDSTYNHDNTLDSNLYYTSSGSTKIRWKWEMKDSQSPHEDFDNLKSIDTNAIFGNPGFVHPTISKADGSEDFAIIASSAPGIDKGDAAQIPNAGTYDFAGKIRVYNSIQDIGAYEYYPASSTASVNYPFPQSLTYPYGIKPDNITQGEMNNRVKTLYDAWKQKYAANDFGEWNGHTLWRVDTSVGHSHNTVSEGQGYGMLLMVMMAGDDTDAKTIFDGMYWFFKKYQNSHGLMKWEILSDGSAPENDNATDGDMDIAMALMMADRQWGSDGDINYAAEGKALITAIRQWNVDSPAADFGGTETNSWRLTCGDWWAGGTDTSSILTRPSDFMVNHLRSFARFAENSEWNNVMDRCYTLLNKMQTDFSSADLVPDFIRDNSEEPAHPNDIESSHDGEYDYNSCRVPWRITIDYLFNGEERSKIIAGKMVAFIKAKTSSDPDAVCDGYKLNGDAYGDNYGSDSVSEAFLPPFGVAAMVDSAHQSWLNSVFDFMTTKDPSQDYFEDSIRLLSALVMSGNWWSPVYTVQESVQSEIDLLSAPAEGKPLGIENGDLTPSLTDGTEFGNIDGNSGSVKHSFTIANRGTASLAVGKISFSGAAAAEYKVTTPPAADILPGESTTFTVTFIPTAGGDRSANLAIENSDSDENLYTCTLHGVGIGSYVVYNLTYLAGAHGSISGTTPQTVPEGGDGTAVTADADAGYHFTDWDDGNTDNPRQDTNVNADMTVTANFAINPTYNLTVVNGSGTGSVVEGLDASIIADAPAAGYHFEQWTTGDGGSFADQNSSTTNYTMPGNDSTVTANYAQNSLALSLAATSVAENGGTVSATVTRDSGIAGDLTVNLTSDDTSAALVPASVIIPDGSSSIDFLITAVDDNRIDGTQSVKISAAASDHIGASEDLDVTDDDTAGFTLDKTELSVIEGGTGTVGVQLTAEPDSNVVLNVLSSNTGDAVVSPAQLTFSAANWNTPQLITVTGVDDSEHGAGSSTLTFSVDPSASDNNFDNIASQNVSVICVDDDPVAQDDSVIVNASASVVINVLANDTDPQGDLLTVSAIVSQPTEGTVAVTGSGSTITYTASSLYGTYLFVYRVSDGGGGTDTATVTVTVGKQVAYGLNFSVKASEVIAPDGSPLSEFTKRPRIYAHYKDPVSKRDKVVSVKVLTRVPAKNFSQVTEVNCEWRSLIGLYDRKELKSANKGGKYSTEWIVANRIQPLVCTLSVKTQAPDGEKFEKTISKQLILSAPEITDVEKWDGASLGSDSLQTEGVVVLKGVGFGIKPPAVWMEYKDDRNRVKRTKLKVQKVFRYKDLKGRPDRNCMDIVTGASELRILMPRRWWKDWNGASSYDFILDNKIGLDYGKVGTSDDSANTQPVVVGDNYNLLKGEKSYLLDILSNDSDAESDSVKILFDTENTLGRVKYDKKTGKVRYTPPKDFTGSDSFFYTLDDGHTEYNNLPANQKVTINIQ